MRGTLGLELCLSSINKHLVLHVQQHRINTRQRLQQVHVLLRIHSSHLVHAPSSALRLWSVRRRENWNREMLCQPGKMHLLKVLPSNTFHYFPPLEPHHIEHQHRCLLNFGRNNDAHHGDSCILSEFKKIQGHSQILEWQASFQGSSQRGKVAARCSKTGARPEYR